MAKLSAHGQEIGRLYQTTNVTAYQTMQAEIDRLRRNLNGAEDENIKLQAINAELRDALCTAAIGAIAIDLSAHSESELEAAIYAQSQYVRGICHAALAKAQQ